MGFKSLVLLIAFAFIAIFSLQNLQSISLVFFSLNSLTLPLSIWIVLSLLAGIISSLVIQFLSNNFVRKNNYSQSYTPQSPTDYPPSPSVTETLPRQEKRQTFSSPPVASSSINNMPSEEDLNVFDDRKIKYTKQKQQTTTNFFDDEPPLTSPSKNMNDSSFPQPDTQKVSKVVEQDTTTSDTNVSFPTPQKSPVQDIPSPAWLKSREASVYSYQPKEKTHIKTTPDKFKSEPNQPKKSPPAKKADGIYDASYRVISPSQDQVNQNDNEDWDDEDWDF